jgi:hypothetical protein
MTPRDRAEQAAELPREYAVAISLDNLRRRLQNGAMLSQDGFLRIGEAIQLLRRAAALAEAPDKAVLLLRDIAKVARGHMEPTEAVRSVIGPLLADAHALEGEDDLHELRVLAMEHGWKAIGSPADWYRNRLAANANAPAQDGEFQLEGGESNGMYRIVSKFMPSADAAALLRAVAARLLTSTAEGRWACLPCSERAGVAHDACRAITHAIGEQCPLAHHTEGQEG